MPDEGKGADGFFEHRLKKPFDARDPAALELLRSLLNTVMIRHSRFQIDIAEGTPIVGLPKTSMQLVRITNDDQGGDNSHHFVYCYIENLCVKYLETISSSTMMNEKVTMQTLRRLKHLLRLACVSIGAGAASTTNMLLPTLNGTSDALTRSRTHTIRVANLGQYEVHGLPFDGIVLCVFRIRSAQ